HSELYVRPLPTGGEQHQVSRGGGTNPIWRGDGKELLFAARDGWVMSVSIDSSHGFAAGEPVRLFRSPSEPFTKGTWHQMDMTADASTFIAIVPEPRTDTGSAIVVQNW